MARCLIEAEINELDSMYAAVEDCVRARNVAADESLSVMAAASSKIFCNIVRRSTLHEACLIGSWISGEMRLSGGGVVGQVCSGCRGARRLVRGRRYS